MNNLLIIGAGQYGLLTKEIAESMNKFDNISFLDDNNSIAIGKINDYKKYIGKYKYAVIAIGNSNIRYDLFEKIKENFTITTIVSPYSYVSNSSIIEDGCIIEPGAIIHANTKIGCSTFICANAIVNHNAEVGKFCHINCGAIIKSNSNIQDFTKIDYGIII